MTAARSKSIVVVPEEPPEPVEPQILPPTRAEILADFLHATAAEQECRRIVSNIVEIAADWIVDNHFERMVIPYTVQSINQQLLALVRMAYVQADDGKVEKERWAIDVKPKGIPIDAFARSAVSLVPSTNANQHLLHASDEDDDGGASETTTACGGESSRGSGRKKQGSRTSTSSSQQRSSRRKGSKDHHQHDDDSMRFTKIRGTSEQHKPKFERRTSTTSQGSGPMTPAGSRLSSSVASPTSTTRLSQNESTLSFGTAAASISNLNDKTMMTSSSSVSKSLTPRLTVSAGGGGVLSDRASSDGSHATNFTPRGEHLAVKKRKDTNASNKISNGAKGHDGTKSEQERNQMLLQELQQQQISRQLEVEELQYRARLDAAAQVRQEARQKALALEKKLNEVIGSSTTGKKSSSGSSPSPSPSGTFVGQKSSKGGKEQGGKQHEGLDVDVVIDSIAGEVLLVDHVPETAVLGPLSASSVPKFAVKRGGGSNSNNNNEAVGGDGGGGQSVPRGGGYGVKHSNSNAKSPNGSSLQQQQHHSPAASSTTAGGSVQKKVGGGGVSHKSGSQSVSRNVQDFVIEEETQSLAPVIYFPAQGVALKEGDARRQAEFPTPKNKVSKKDFLRSLTPYFRSIDGDDDDEEEQQQKNLQQEPHQQKQATSSNSAGSKQSQPSAGSLLPPLTKVEVSIASPSQQQHDSRASFNVTDTRKFNIEASSAAFGEPEKPFQAYLPQPIPLLPILRPSSFSPVPLFQPHINKPFRMEASGVEAHSVPRSQTTSPRPFGKPGLFRAGGATEEEYPAAEGPHLQHDKPHFGTVRSSPRAHHSPTSPARKETVMSEVMTHRKQRATQKLKLKTKLETLHALPTHTSHSLVLHPE